MDRKSLLRHAAEKPSTTSMRLYLAAVLVLLVVLHLALLFDVYDLMRTVF